MTIKGVILAGGKGTRLHPLTHVTSKQLLPVYNKPMIYYPLSVLMMAGVRDVMIISTVQDVHRFQSLFDKGEHLGINIHYGTQDEPLGIAHAFLVAKDFIGDDSVALVLGDNIFYGSQLDGLVDSVKEPMQGATIFGYEVSTPEKYGVLEFDSEKRIKRIIEKPKVPPSNYAVTGLYFYDNKVMEIAENLTPSARGELEITDVNNIYLEKGMLDVVLFGRGFAWFDSGSFDQLHKASTYVQILEKTHNTKIGCIEEIAYRKGWINNDQLLKLAEDHLKSGYGEYLQYIAKTY